MYLCILAIFTCTMSGAASDIVVGGAQLPFPVNFGLSEICRQMFFLSENLCPKMHNLDLKTPL